MSKSINILIVDDEHQHSFLAKTIINNLYPGIKIDETGNGIAAIINPAI
ncbi:MAG: hypothetical protein HQL08_08400 [Nitrospirae bacterium]|nr:hypothetical protein [Nitrospirota bacterium]